MLRNRYHSSSGGNDGDKHSDLTVPWFLSMDALSRSSRSVSGTPEPGVARGEAWDPGSDLHLCLCSPPERHCLGCFSLALLQTGKGPAQGPGLTPWRRRQEWWGVPCKENEGSCPAFLCA